MHRGDGFKSDAKSGPSEMESDASAGRGGTFRQKGLTRETPRNSVEYLDQIVCIHSLNHIMCMICLLLQDYPRAR